MLASAAAQESLLPLTHDLVDETLGVIRSLEEVRNQIGAPAFFHYSARLPNIVEVGAQPCSYWTGAASATRQGAALRALTDAVTCYCAAYRFQAVMPPVCSVRASRLPVLTSAEFDWFSAEQYARPDFPWRPFTEDTQVYWMEALDPLLDEQIFVPAAFTALPHTVFAEQGEVSIAPATSTGLACHTSIQQCAIAAICDVIECDALSVAWLRGKSLGQIRVETLSDANYDLVSRFEKAGGAITLFIVPSEFGALTVLATLSSQSASAPARIFAAGTDLRPEEAVRKSLEMLAHVQQYSHLLHEQMPPLVSVSPDYAEVVDQATHLRYWCNHDNAREADFLFSSRERIQFDDLKDKSIGEDEKDLDQLVRRIHDAGFRVLLADLTTPDIRETGLVVLRALIPRLCPILYGSQALPLGSRRVRSYTSDINRRPHPFPRKGVVA